MPPTGARLAPCYHSDDMSSSRAGTLPTEPVNQPFEVRLERYADLLLRVGVNLQEGQGLVIRASLEAAPLVRLLVDRAYASGCPQVEVMWSDDAVTRSRFLSAPDGTFDRIAAWRAQGMTSMAEAGFASLGLTSDDPDLLQGTDPERWATYVRRWQGAVTGYTDVVMSNRTQWSLAAYAGRAWAAKVFPDVNGDEAVRRLWDAIFHAARSDVADPVLAWRDHQGRLRSHVERLNARRYVALHFRGPGTDLRVGLAHGHVWEGAKAVTPEGVRFAPNIPTEEVFTAPHRQQVDGNVRATLPLVNGGNLIEGIELRFEAGRVVDAKARSGFASLRRILDTDDGASRLGEVALVPVSSPVRTSGLLFYRTLFDENAASHLALGRAYPGTVAGGADMTPEARAAAGLNASLTHVDFMIGSAEVDVDGELASGEREGVMQMGEWV